MSIYCPGKTNPHWIKMVEVLGSEALAFDVWNYNNDLYLEEDRVKESPVYKGLLSTHGEKIALKIAYLTYTSNFQKWFGNWYKAQQDYNTNKVEDVEDVEDNARLRDNLIDIYNLSQVVDDSLNPLVVYRHNFIVNPKDFDYEKGFHLTENEEIANQAYNGNRIHATFINSKKLEEVPLSVLAEKENIEGLSRDNNYVAINDIADPLDVHREYLIFDKNAILQIEGADDKGEIDSNIKIDTSVIPNINEAYNTNLALNSKAEEDSAINLAIGIIQANYQEIASRKVSDIQVLKLTGDIQKYDIKRMVADQFNQYANDYELTDAQRDFHARVRDGILNSNPSDKDYYKSLWTKIKNKLKAVHKQTVTDIDEVEFVTSQVDDIDNRRTEFNDWKRDQISTTEKVLPKIMNLLMTTPLLKDSQYITDDNGSYEYNFETDNISGLSPFFFDKYGVNWFKERLVNATSARELLEILRDLSKSNPSLIQIVHKLENDTELLSAFYTTFAQTNMGTKWVEVKTMGDKFEYAIRDSYSSDERIIANEWNGDILSFIERNPNSKLLKTAIERLNAKFENSSFNITDKTFIELVEELSNYLRMVGISLPKSALLNEIAEYIANNNTTESKKKFKSNVLYPAYNVAKFIEDYKPLEIKEEQTEESEDKPVNEGVFNRLNQLARIKVKFAISDSELMFRNTEGEQMYGITVASYFTDWMNELYSEDKITKQQFEDNLRTIATLSSTRYSNLFVDEKGDTIINADGTISLDNVKRIKAFFTGGIKNTRTGEGNSYKSMVKSDWTLHNLLAYLSGDANEAILTTPILSDSSKSFVVSFVRIPILVGDIVDGKLSRNSKLYNHIFNLVLQDIDKIEQTKRDVFEVDEYGKFIKENNEYVIKKDKSNWIKNFHYTKRNDKGEPELYDKNGNVTGNGFNATNITSLNSIFPSYRGIISDDVTADLLNRNRTRSDNETLNKVHQAVEKLILDVYTGMHNRTIGFKEELKDTVAEKLGKRPFEVFIMEYALNQLLYNAEMQNLWLGNTSEYATVEEVVKRAKQIAAPGYKLSTIHSSPITRVVTIADVKQESGIYDEMRTALQDKFNLEDSIINILIGKKGKSKYGNINTTDAQGIINITTLVNWYKDIGKFDKIAHLVENTGKLTKNGATVKYRVKDNLTYQDYMQLFEPIKPFYYNRTINKELNKLISNQFKLHLTPGIDAIFGGTQMAEIIKYMEDNDIDVLAFESAEKDGISEVTTLHDENGNLIPFILTKLQPKDTDTSHWRIQQDVPEHIEDEVNKFGVQITKLILSNIKESDTYTLSDGRTMNGKQIANHYLEVISQIVRNDTKALLDKLGDLSDIRNIKDILYREAVDRGFSDGEIEALQTVAYTGLDGTEHYGFNVPLFFSAYLDKWMAILTSQFTNNIAKWKVPGLHAVLVSNAFANRKNLTKAERAEALSQATVELDKLIEEGEIPVGERDDRLAAMQDLINKGVLGSKTLKSYIENDAIVFECAVPAWSKEFFDEEGKLVNIDKLPDNLKQMIGYRIPTSGKHSAVILKVVRFIPSEAGSVIQLPMDVVVRMGSDFDVDSLFVTYFNFRKDYKDDFHKIEFSAKDNQLHQRYIDYINREVDNYIVKQEKTNAYLDVKSEIRTLYNDAKTDYKEQVNSYDALLEGTYNDGYRLFKKLPKILKEYYWEAEDKVKLNKGITKQLFYRDFTISLLEQINEKIASGTWENKEVEAAIPTLNKLIDAYNIHVELVTGRKLEKERIYSEVFDKFRSEKSDIYSDIKDIPVEVAIALANEFDLIQIDEFAKLPIYEQNSHKALQNEYTNVLISILGNKASFVEGVRPVEYEESRKLAEFYNKLVGVNKNLNPIYPHHQEELRERAFDGKNLIAIFASNNTAMSVLSFVNAKLNPDLAVSKTYSLEYLRENDKLVNLSDDDIINYLETKYGATNVTVQDNKVTIKHTNIGWTIDGNNNNIYDNATIDFALSQLLDHSTDAVKVPLVNNLNTFTASIVLPLLIDGDIRTAFAFINQPAIRRISEIFFQNEGVVFGSDRSEVSQVKREYQTELFKLLYKDSKIKEIQDKVKAGETRTLFFNKEEQESLLKIKEQYYSFTIEEMDKAIEDGKGVKYLTDEQKIAYYDTQIKIIENYNKLTKTGKALSDTAMFLRYDKLGVSPNLDETRNLIQKMKEEMITNTNQIKTPRVFVNGMNIVASIYPKFVREYLNDHKEIVDNVTSSYPSLETSFISCNLGAIKAISPLFLTENAHFRNSINDVLQKLLPVNKDKREFVQRRARMYFLKLLLERKDANDFLESTWNSAEVQSQLLGVDKVADINLNIDFLDFITKSVAEQLAIYKLKAKDIAFNERHIINYLHYKISPRDVANNGFHAIELRNVAKDNKTLSELQHSLNQMWFAPKNEFEKVLAENIVKYIGLTSGFSGIIGRVISPLILRETGIASMLHRLDDVHRADVDNMLFTMDYEQQELFIRNNARGVLAVSTRWEKGKDGKSKIMWGTPRWTTSLNYKESEIGKDLIIIPNEKVNTARLPYYIQNAQYLKVYNKDTSSYILYKRYNSEFAGTNIVYYPLDYLGNHNFMETQYNILSKNNKFKSPDVYVDFISDNNITRDEKQKVDEDDTAQKEEYAKTFTIETEEVTKHKIANLQRAFNKIGIPIKVIIDETITNAQVDVEDGVTVIRYNPNYTFGTTMFHEHGHILVDLIGYNSNYIQKAIDELRGTELWNEIEFVWKSKYADNAIIRDDVERMEKEILVAAIGINADKIFKNVDSQVSKGILDKFLYYIRLAIYYLRDKLNLGDKYEQLARQLVNGKIKSKVNGTSSNYIQEEVFWKPFSTIDNNEQRKQTLANIERLIKESSNYTVANITDSKGNIIDSKYTYVPTKDELERVTKWLERYRGSFDTDKIEAAKTSLTGRTNKNMYNMLNIKTVEDVIAFWEWKRVEGVNAHDVLDRYIKGKTGRAPVTISDEDMELFSSQLKTKIDRLISYYGKEFVISELRIGDRRHKIAGTLDIIVINHKGKALIYDLKTKQRNGFDYFNSTDLLRSFKAPFTLTPFTKATNYSMQLSMYKFLLNQYGIEVEGMAILPLQADVRLDDKGNYEYYNYTIAEDEFIPVQDMSYEFDKILNTPQSQEELLERQKIDAIRKKKDDELKDLWKNQLTFIKARLEDLQQLITKYHAAASHADLLDKLKITRRELEYHYNQALNDRTLCETYKALLTAYTNDNRIVTSLRAEVDKIYYDYQGIDFIKLSENEQNHIADILDRTRVFIGIFDVMDKITPIFDEAKLADNEIIQKINKTVKDYNDLTLAVNMLKNTYRLLHLKHTQMMIDKFSSNPKVKGNFQSIINEMGQIELEDLNPFQYAMDSGLEVPNILNQVHKKAYIVEDRLAHQSILKRVYEYHLKSKDFYKGLITVKEKEARTKTILDKYGRFLMPLDYARFEVERDKFKENLDKNAEAELLKTKKKGTVKAADWRKQLWKKKQEMLNNWYNENIEYLYDEYLDKKYANYNIEEKAKLIIEEKRKEFVNEAEFDNWFNKNFIRFGKDRVYPKTTGVYAIPKENKYRNQAYYDLEANDKVAFDMLTYLSKDLLPTLMEKYSHGIIIKGFMPAIPIRYDKEEEEFKEGREHVMFDTTGEAIYQLGIRFNALINAKDTISFPTRESKETQEEYETRVLEEVNAKGHTKKDGSKFVTIDEIKERNKEIETENLERHADSILYDLDKSIPEFIASAEKYNFRKNIESHILLMIAAARNAKIVERKGVIKDYWNKAQSLVGKEIRTKSYAGEASLVYKKLQEDTRRIFYDLYTDHLDNETVERILNHLNTYQTLLYLGGNIFSATKNMMYGTISNFSEATAKEFFGVQNWLNAQKIYYSGVGSYIGTEDVLDLSRSKQQALIKYFNIFMSQNEFKDYTNTKIISKAGFKKYFNKLSNILLIGQTNTEHQLQGTLLFALLDSYRVTENGKIENITDYKVRTKSDIADENFSKFPKVMDIFDYTEDEVKKGRGNLTVKAEIVEKYPNIERELVNFSVLGRQINRHLHGAYDKEGSAMVNSNPYLRPFMKFRRWARRGWIRRWGVGKTTDWDESLQRTNPGDYKVTFGLLGIPFNRASRELWNPEEAAAIDEIRGYHNRILKSIKHYSIFYKTAPTSYKSAIRRSMTEMILAPLLLFLLRALLSGARDKNKKLKHNKLINFLMYELDGTMTEVLAYIPIYGWINEGNKMISNPAALWSIAKGWFEILYDIRDLTHIALSNKRNMKDAYYKSGKYSKELKLKVHTIQMTPILKQIKRWETIDKNNRYYKRLSY